MAVLWLTFYFLQSVNKEEIFAVPCQHEYYSRFKTSIFPGQFFLSSHPNAPAIIQSGIAHLFLAFYYHHALEIWKKLDEQNDIPIIALTAHAFEDDRRKCLSAGMNDFITKPVNRKILYNTLHKWI